MGEVFSVGVKFKEVEFVRDIIAINGSLEK